MSFDIVVFDENYRYYKQLHLHAIIQKALFRKLITATEYPYLHKAADDKEDLVYELDDVPFLKADVEKLEKYLETEKLMAAEIKNTCLTFVRALKDACDGAIEKNRGIDFIAGE